MNLQDARKKLPELAGLSDESALNVIHQVYYPTMDKADLSKRLGIVPPEAPAPERTWGGLAKDVGITALKGAIGVPEAVVGMADLVSGGQVGKTLEGVGFRPKEAKEILSEYYSDKQKQAFAEVQKAEGVMGTMEAALKNPSVIAHSIGESVPSMLAGGVVGRGVMAGARMLGAKAGAGIGAGAIGEGVIAAGSAGEQIRQQTTDGLLTGEQAGAGAATGVATAVLGALGGKVAKKLGIADVDTMLVGAAKSPAAQKGIVRSVLEGAVSEGVLEELPQSISEQVLQNYALGKPLEDGVDQAAVLGLLSGAAMGAGANVMHNMGQKPSTPAPADPGKAVAHTIMDAKLVPETGPMTRAANVATAMEADKVRNEINSTSLTGASMADMLQGPANPLQSAMQSQADPVVNESLTAAVPAADQTEKSLDMVPPGVDPATGEVIQPASQPDPLDFTGKTDAELTQARKSAQDPAIRKALATELQARRAAAAPAAPAAPAAKQGYEQRNADRIQRAAQAQDQTDLDAITAEENADGERHFVGTDGLRMAVEKRNREMNPRPLAVTDSHQLEKDVPGKLPADLASAKEKYNYGNKSFTPTFDSDVDRAAFIVSQKTPSKRDADYLKFAMDATGMTEAEVRAHGQKVRDSIKGLAKGAEPGALKVPKVEYAKANQVDDINVVDLNSAAPAAITPETGKPADAAPVQASAVTAETGQTKPVMPEWEDMTPEQRKRSRLEKEISTGQTNNGGVVASLRPSAIEKRKQELANMGDAGKIDAAPVTQPATSGVPEAGAGATQPPQAAPAPSEEQEQWTRATTADRIGIARAGGIALKPAENVAKKAWGDLAPEAQEKLVRGIAKQKGEPKPQPTNTTMAKTTVETSNGEVTVETSFALSPEMFKKTYGEDGAILNFKLSGDGVTEGMRKLITGVTVKGDMDPASLRTLAIELAEAEAAKSVSANDKKGAKDQQARIQSGLQKAMGDSGWTAEVAGDDNTIWTKSVNGERYTARFTPTTSNMEVTVLVNGVDTQMDSFKVKGPTTAAVAADAAVASDVEEDAPANVEATDTTTKPVDSAPKNGPVSVGKNEDGQDLMEDANRLRYYVVDGVRIGEPVRIVPGTNRPAVNIANRRDEFKTVAELEAEKPAAVAAAPRRIQPGEPGYTLAMAREDLQELHDKNAGMVEDGRINVRIKQQEKLIKDMQAEQKPQAQPDPVKPARLPEAVQDAIENQLRKQKARIARLTREADAADLTLEQKLAAQTKVKAAEATQRKLRTSIFEAEDAAEAAIRTKDAALFAPHADLFPDAAAEIQKALGQNDELDAEMRSYEAKAEKPAAKPTDPDAAAKAKAQQDLDDALGELGMILTKGIRKNMMPEQERALLPVLTQVMDASFRLGYYKFKESARFVLDKVRAKFGGEVADMITLDHLQGAYIGMAGKYQADGASTKKEVIAIESLDELADPVANEPTTGENPPQAPRTEQEANNESQIPQDGQRPLDETPAEDGGEAAKAGGSGGDIAAGSEAGDRSGGGVDAAGVSAPRSRGSRTRRISDPAARPKRVGGRRGADAKGAAVPGVDAGATGDNADGVKDLFAQPDVTAETSSAPNIPAANFKIEEDLALGEGGEAAKFKDNIAAIRTLKAIEADKRRATPEEQRTLARFVGWGGLANAFPNPETGQFKAGWEKRGQEVQDLLTPSEIRAASRSTRNAHYTSPTVVKAMWSMAHRLGFRDGLALESSMGVGNFLGLMPSNVSARFIGVEYDSLTARIAAALYPQATVLETGFQKVPLPDNAFDLSIGNPPFGDESLRFQYRPELNGDSIHNQFFRASMAALKPERLHIQVVSRYLMDRQDKKARIALARDADLVAAIRLPDNAFKENARTEVVTDIIILKKRTPADKARMDAILDAYIAPKEKNADKERERRQLADQAPKWLDTAEIKDPLGGENMVVNRYFQENPGQIIGTMERSGSMRFKNDVTVRLDDAKELEARLSQLVEKLPKDIVSTADDVAANTENAYKVLGEALSMAVAREEVGHIKTDADGKMTRAVERDFEGEQVLTRQEVSANSPWSRQLSMDNLGRWYKLDVRMDEQGKPVKALDKNGKPTRTNSFVRTTYLTEAEVPSTLRLGEMGFAKLKEVVALRDMLKRQLVLETEDSTKEMMEGNRKKLAQAYRAFVEKFGPVNRLANARLVADMPDAGLILALESEYEPARTKEQAAKSGLPQQDERVREAPILSERVVPKYEPPTAADTPADALAITLAERGVVNMDHIAALLGMTPEQAEADLTGGEKPLVFKDPETNSFETANAYLSGQVRRKLMAAKSAGLTQNVKALEAVQPERWSAENVSVQVGSTWVPPDVYADFLSGLIGGDVTVTFSPLTNTFVVTAKNSNATKNDAWSSEGATASWIFGRMLNSQTPTITYTDSDGKVHTNKEATSLAILKSREFVTEFQDWIFKDGERRERLVEIFNEKFNTRVTRQYDGSHLKLPGKVPDSIIQMRRHQMNAIWRGISSKFLLIDHAVGAGKTFTGIARAMERRRMGLAQKPAIVVPNHLVEQWQADVYKLYPGAKVLAASKADFEKKNRRKLFGRIATGDYDIVILPHSALVKIGISPETEQRYLEQELKDALEAVKDAEEQAKEDGHEGFRKPMGVKEAERLVTKIQTRMDKLSERATDRLLTFEQLGIDDLTVDEAHEFKNLFYSSRLTKVRGMGDKTGSGKAADLYNKVRVLRDNGGAVVFMTGTPVSNSVVELYTMMRYLAANELRESGMEHFDAWRTQFVDAEPAFEPDESNRLKEVTRLGRSWSNMRSMMDLYYQFTDAVSIDDIKEWYAADNGGKPFPVPKVKGGERQLVKMQPTPAQESMLREVIAGFDGLEYINDTMERNAERLRLMDRARKLSLDVRAAAPGSTSPEKGGKLERVSAEVKRIYDKTTGDRGTQLIFLDRSVPKAKGDDKLIKEYDELMAKRDKAMAEDDDAKFKEINEALEKFDANEITELRNAQNGGWNAYQQIKDNLIASGIPADQIRFVQEANTDEQKQALFDAVNGGKVRVLIGSTPRMGAGTNVQKRLVGLHHVDVTWKPSDIEQREGRIVRQGNELLTKYGPDFEVEVLAYATERTVDAKMWSLNATKLKAINGLRKYTGDFSMDVEDEESVSMAEMAALASGNPLLLERVTLESAINGLELQEKAFRRKMYGAQDALESAEKVINTYPEMIKQSRDQAKALAERVQAVSNLADKRRVTVEGQEFDGYKDALKKAQAAVESQQEGNENGRYAININGERVTSKAGIEDAIGQALGDDAAFEVEIGGASINQRTRAGRELSAILSPKAQEADGRSEGTIGKMFGYDLVYQFQPNRFDKAKVDLVLALENGGKTVASADVNGHDPMIKFTTPQLRDALGNMAAEVESKASGQNANYMERRLEAAESDIDTLRKRVTETFPKTEEIKEKRARLKRVIALLSSDATEDVGSDAAGLNIRQTGAMEGNTTDVVFSRGTGRGIEVETAQGVVDGIASRWTNAPEIVVVADLQDTKVPERVRLYDAEQRSQGASGEPEGFWYGGKAYIVAAAINTPQDVARVLFHETLGHYGLRGTFGEGLTPILKQLAAMRRPLVAAKAEQYGLDMGKESDRLQAAEEVLAEMAQSTPSMGYVKRAIAAIRAFLRKNVPGFQKMALTDADIIAQYILPARAFVERGPGGGPKGGLGFSRSKSGVVSADGFFKSWPKFNTWTRSEYQDVVSLLPAEYRNDPHRQEPIAAKDWDALTASALPDIKALKQKYGVMAFRFDALGNIGADERDVGIDAILNDAVPVAKKHGLGVFITGVRTDSIARLRASGFESEMGLGAVLMRATRSSQPPLAKEATMTAPGTMMGLNTRGFPAPMFSRSLTAPALAGQVRDKLNETFNHPGKLSWWHKTVGSQYNLAERSPAYKRVFDAAQDFINDVSYYATEAANMAPKILPKLETLKDLTKTAISAADNKAVAAPVFEGTLSWARDADGKPIRIEALEKRYENLTDDEKAQMLLRKNVVSEAQLKAWKASKLDVYQGAIRNRFESTFLKAGVRWTDAELKSIFKLTDEQVGLYKEFRAATDTSLDNMAKAQMLREAGKDVADMRDMVMEAPDVDTAAMMLREVLLDMANDNPDRADILKDAAAGVLATAAKINDLKKQGYAPLSRFGRFTVDVVVDGQREYFGLFESEGEANRMAAKMRAEFGADNVAQGTMSQKEFELFQGITPESLELFGNMMGLDSTGNEAQDKAFQTYLKLTKNNRSAMKRLIHRQGIAGYSEDVGRVLAAFVYANARQTSAALHIGQMDEAITAIPKGEGELKDHALELAKYIKEPREEAAALRGLMFAQYLGGSVASAMVNFTQPLTVSIPYLSQFGGLAKAGKAWAQAVKDMSKGTKLEPGLERALKDAEESGVVSPQEVHQLMAQARGASTLQSGDGTKLGDAKAKVANGWTRTALAWGKLFGYAEQVNRRSTFIAAYRMAVDQKIPNPGAFAEKAVNETQFVNNKANKMKFGRGAIGATLMTFKSYSIHWLELMHRLSTQDGKDGKLAAAYMLGALFLVAGAGGLPFAGDAEDLIDAIAQKMGYNFSAKKSKQEFLESVFGKAGAQFVDRGITGLPGVPIDVSGRMGMANLLPGTGLLLEKKDHTSDMMELAGPAGDMAKRFFEAVGMLAKGEVGKAVETAAPKAVGNMIKGADMLDKGMYRDTKGAKVIDTTTGEALAKIAGFQPASVSQVQESNYINQRAKDFYNLKTQEIRAKWAMGIFESDPDKVKEARQMMEEWNSDNPDQRMTANMPAIVKKVREMRKDKAQRIADTAPKAMRAQMREDAKELANR